MMNERPKRHDFDQRFLREVSRGPTEKWLAKRAEWMVAESGVQEYLAPKIKYKDRLAGKVEEGLTVLSVGAGKGHELDELDSLLPGSRIIGADPHDHWTRPVKHRAETLGHDISYLPEGVSAEHLDGVEDKSLDGATLYFVLHHIPQEKHSRVLQELHRTLKDDGFVFITEDLVGSAEEKKVTERTDRQLNLEIREAPHEYRDADEWKHLFKEQGFEVVNFHEDKPKKVRHGFFVLRKAPEESGEKE